MTRRSGRGVGAAVALSGALALGLAGCARNAADETGRPNLALFVVESLRADHVHAYGYARETTPSIDALAAEGVAFTRAHSVTSWTLTSHASIFTGLYPTAHQVTLPGHRLDDSYVTLAEVLAGEGYQTAGFVAGPYLRGIFNLHQGFEIYDQSAAAIEPIAAHGATTNPRLEEVVTRFLREQREEPFFLFVYVWDPHYDYLPPAPWDSQFVPPDAEPIDLTGYQTRRIVHRRIPAAQLAYVVSQYDGEIRATDEMLGRIWGVMREQGVWERTAVVLTADHAEAFFEHGRKGHKHDLYQEALHVPLVLKPPGPAAARRDDRPVSLVDLFPTLLELAGTQVDLPFHGRSLLAPEPAEPRLLFFELLSSWYWRSRRSGRTTEQTEQWYAVRDGDYKLVARPDRFELYDLRTDPAERRPLEGREHREQLDRLRERLVSYRRTMDRLAESRGEARMAELSEEDRQLLEQLGYLPPADSSE